MRGVKVGNPRPKCEEHVACNPSTPGAFAPPKRRRQQACSGLTGAETADTKKIHQPVTFSDTQARKSRPIFQRESPGS